jgi:hypothetical protein
MRRNAAGHEKEAVVAAALRLRAGNARALRVADDVSLRTLLVPPPAQGVDSLCACDVSAAALNCAFDALDGARFQLPARLRLLHVLLSDATGLPECEALRLLTRPVAAQLTDSAVTAKAVAAAASTEVADADAAVALQAQQEAAADAAFASAADAAQLHIRLAPAFLQYLEADDDDMGDDARVVRCARLGRALARQTWPRVTVELVELDDSLTETEEGGSAALATLLEVCFSAMQDELDTLHLAPLALDRRCTFDLRKSNAMLDVPDACRVARAAPPHVTLLFAEVLLDSFQDADALAVMLGAGRVAGAEISLRNFHSVDAPLMSRVAAALSAAAAADGSDFALDLGGNTSLKMVDDAHVFSSLRGLTALRGLCVFPESASLPALLSVLPLSLRTLTLRGDALTNETPLLVAAMLSGQLPLLERLTLYASQLNDGESARSLAESLRARSAPFSLYCQFEEGSCDVLTALLKSAPPASGVPAYAADMLRLVAGPIPVGELPELVAAVFAALRHDTEACALDSVTSALQACQPDYGATAFAQLLLHWHNEAPSEMAPLLSSPQRVLLIAARVLRARSQLAAPEDLMFTPLLHRMLLIVAGGTGTLPLSVLSSVAAACLRDQPADPAAFAGADEEREQLMARVFESRQALLALLLAGALAGEAVLSDPALAAASSALDHHAEWMLGSVSRFCAQAADPSAGVRFLRPPNVFDVLLKFNARDAALHLWAVSRVPSLAGALWDIGEGDTRLYFLRTSWLSKIMADPIAEPRLFEALGGLLSAVVSRRVFEMWLLRLHVPGADGLSGWASVLDVEALCVRLSRLKQRRDAARGSSPAAAAALAIAHTHVATILRRCRAALASPGLACAMRCCAQLAIMSASPTPERRVLKSASRELIHVLRQWMRAGTPRAVLGSYLLPRALEIILELLPGGSTELPSPPAILAHNALLACCLQVWDEADCNVPDVCVRASDFIIVSLRSILKMRASAGAADAGCESLLNAGLLLRAAGEVFSRCPADQIRDRCTSRFGAVVSELLTAGWVRANGWDALNPNAAAEAAAAAYRGLAQLLATSAARHVLNMHLSDGARAVLDRLGGELVQLSRLRCDPAEVADARADLRELLRVLLPVLEPRMSSCTEARNKLTSNAEEAVALIYSKKDT